MNQTDYFENAITIFSGVSNYYTDNLELAGRKIKLQTPSAALRKTFIFSLSHLLSEIDVKEPDLTILYAENKDLPYRLHCPPIDDFNAQGFNANAEHEDVQIFFQPWQQQVFIYSSAKKTGIYWVANAIDIPWWEPTFSFRAIFHLWTRDLPAQLVHAGAIANNYNGVLITGASGSGKSTSCLNLLRAGYKYLGDDYVWVELGPVPEVHALYQTAKVEPDNFQQRFSDWKKYLTNGESYLNQKAILDIKKMLPAQWRSSMPLKAIFVPLIVEKEETMLYKANTKSALFAMAPTTLHHLPHNRVLSYKKLLTLTGNLPAYSWELGRDIIKFQSSFAEFIDNEVS